MRPPNATKSAVYQWNTAVTDTCRQLGKIAGHVRVKMMQKISQQSEFRVDKT